MDNLIKRPDSAAMRDAIFRLEELIESIPGNGVEENGTEIVHRFGAGTYAREMIVPPDMLITGAVHRTEHVSIFLEGKMIVAGPGGESMEIEAPIVEIGRPGIKRAGITLSRVRWITIHATDETDIDKLEEMLLTNDPDEAQIIIDQQDYLMIQEPPELLEKLKVVPVFHAIQPGVEIQKSLRHGQGVFATRYFYAGDRVAPGIMNGDLMTFSRYMNHSADPNVTVEWEDGDAWFVAIKDISNEEIVVDYRTTLGEQE